MALLSLLLMCITLIIMIIVHRTKSAMNYWNKRRIPYLRPELFFGNTKDMILLRTTIFECYQTLYHKLEGHRFGGFFQMGTPYLMIRDPNLIQAILVEDFDHFHDRGLRFNKKADPLSEHIFLLGGQQWRSVRNVLNPAFTSDNIKKMFFLMEDCSKRMVDSLREQAEYMENIDLKEISARFSADVIAACGFGIDCNSIGNPQSVFIEIGNKIFEPTIKAALKTLIIFTMPVLADIFGISFISKDVNEFFKWLSKETIKYREDNNVKRSDFIHLLMKIRDKRKMRQDANNNGSTENKSNAGTDKEFEFTDNVFAAQLLIMFLAGLEMISSVMSFCLYELAINPEIQTKLRVEIDSSLRKHGSKLDYDSVEDMPYMDMVISETLRMYPPVGMFLRECTKPYRIPDTNVTIERGTRVCVPIYALHKDPQYFPRPELFNPERFSTEHSGLPHPFTYLPFGDGPRICIEITDSLMTAQVLVLFLVGFEMTSSALSFCVLELAANPEIQNKCRIEIDRVMKKHDGKLCYEAVQEMRYLDMVLQETLRLYPPLGYFTRECTEPYPIPDSNVVLERGTTVVICPYAMHRDPTYFPDPLKFDPQRFSEDNIHDLPSVYLPFGEGPRACIGMRFALVEMKACLAAFLSKYEFSKCLKTQMPPRLEPRKIVTEVADGLWVRIRRRAWINCD